MAYAHEVDGVVRFADGTKGVAALLLDQNGNVLVIGGAGGTSSTDDAAFTAGASSLTPVGGIVTADSVDAGDAGAFAMLANRQQKITLYDSSGVEITSFGGGTAGDVAHDAADSGNPVKVGAKATNVEPTAVSASGDRINLIADLVGKLIVLPYANPENFVSGAITSAMTGTTSTSLLAAPAAGLRNYITQLTISNSHATVNTDVVVQDGNGGTTFYIGPGPALGGSILTFPTPLRQPTTATAVYVANVTTGASVKAAASGYKGA